MKDLPASIINKGANLSCLDKYGNDGLWKAVLYPGPSLPLIELLIKKVKIPAARMPPGGLLLTWR
jgi:hypothetical protein